MVGVERGEGGEGGDGEGEVGLFKAGLARELLAKDEAPGVVSVLPDELSGLSSPVPLLFLLFLNTLTGFSL